jgi:hypothetical protein
VAASRAWRFVGHETWELKTDTSLVNNVPRRS